MSSSLSLGRAVCPDTAKGSLDVEMDGKRQAVAEEEFDDIQSQIESGGVLERSGTYPPNSSWGSRKGSWEITPDVDAIASEFGMEHGSTTAREKIQGHL